MLIKQLIERTLGRFTNDERAVSPVVGFVLIFALIMIVFTLYQTNVVPAQNTEVEFKHSQEVETQLSQLNDAISRTGSTGVSQSATVATGLQYPDRALAINPGAPTGSLRTSSDPTGNPYSVTVENVKATGENAKYFDLSKNSDSFTFKSKELIYGINYNEYQQDPQVTIAPGLQFTEFQSGSVVNSVDIITGNRIDLTLLDPDSDYQQSSMSASVDVKPTSATADYITIEPDGGNPQLTIETSLDAGAGADLATKLEGNEKVKNAVYSSNAITLTLEKGTGDQTYQLRVAEVGIGSSDKPDAEYLVSDTPTTQTLSLGETATFTVTARDRFGNPVSGTDVTATANYPDPSVTGSFVSGSDPLTKTTNEGGQATFEFRPDTVTGDPIGVDVTLDNGGGGTDLSKVTYSVEANTRQGFIDNGFNANILIDSVDLVNKNQLDVVFESTRSKQATATTIQLNGFLSKKNKPVRSATIGSTNIPFNQGPTVLGSDEFTVPAGGSETVTLNLDDSPNGVGLLIIDVTFEVPTSDGGTQTITATYATSVDNS